MTGRRLSQQGATEEVIPGYFSVKEAVFPFIKFPGADPILGPEMKSTGEVMGLDHDFGIAFAKSQLGAGVALPTSGKVFLSVKDADKEKVLGAAKALIEMDFSVVCTDGTAAYLREQGLEVERVNKVREGRPHIVDAMKSGKIDLVFNTTEGAKAIADSFDIRHTALGSGIPYYTTVAGCNAAVQAIRALKGGQLEVAPLQSYFVGSF
jgi:carbamoyl-phosphate synthase large subunit